jgi:hypothetical protein
MIFAFICFFNVPTIKNQEAVTENCRTVVQFVYFPTCTIQQVYVIELLGFHRGVAGISFLLG